MGLEAYSLAQLLAFLPSQPPYKTWGLMYLSSALTATYFHNHFAFLSLNFPCLGELYPQTVSLSKSFFYKLLPVSQSR